MKVDWSLFRATVLRIGGFSTQNAFECYDQLRHLLLMCLWTQSICVLPSVEFIYAAGNVASPLGDSHRRYSDLSVAERVAPVSL